MAFAQASRPLPTAATVRKLFSYNKKTGELTRLTRTARCTKIGEVAGSVWTDGFAKYRLVSVDNVQHKMHRIIWLLVTGKWPAHVIDHINGDGVDNRWCNLRAVTAVENSRNRRLCRRNTSGCPGVWWRADNKKWRVLIRVNGRLLHLGHFEELDIAIAARKAAEVKHGFHPNHGTKRQW